MKKFSTLVAFLLTACFIFAQEQYKGENEGWLVSLEEAYQQSNKTGKPIMANFTGSDWCGWCKKMDKATYEHAEVIDYVNTNFHAVKFNAEQREDVTVKGSTFKYIAQGRRGYHELAASMLQGKLGYPATVFLDNEFNMLTHGTFIYS